MNASMSLPMKPAHRPEGATESQRRPNIEWDPPAPRSGFVGGWDRFVGPGATRAEVWLQLAIPLAAAVAAAVWPTWAGLSWPGWKSLIAGLLALDIVGGVITNSTSTAKRWYHRQGQGARQHLSFVAIHVVQLGLVGWLFRDHDWSFVVANYALLLTGSALIVFSPRYLQKPVASSVYLVALLVSLVPVSLTPGLEWFLPMFFLKLFISHLPFEAPLAPTTSPIQGA